MLLGPTVKDIWSNPSDLKIYASKELSESNDGVVPWHSCPCMKGKLATQAGSTPFGTFRENVTHVREKVNIHNARLSAMELIRIIKHLLEFTMFRRMRKRSE